MPFGALLAEFFKLAVFVVFILKGTIFFLTACPVFFIS
jgi:hypothetical protein